MRLQLLSDLHLEAQPHWQPTPAPGADVLVLAGDIGSYQAGSLLGDADFGLARFSPRHGWPCPVIYVPGNHEYDGQDFDQAHQRLQEICQRLGLIWLERGCTELMGVQFIGTTLWTDFDALAAQVRPGRAEAAREKAFRAANHYLRKTGGTRGGQPLLADGVRELGLICQDWLREALAAPRTGPRVVVTHFAPSLLSADPRYGLVPGTAGFCNALDDLLPQADLWLHGHLHAPSDYLHKACRVVANPLGYASKGEQAAFQATALVDVPQHRGGG